MVILAFPGLALAADGAGTSVGPYAVLAAGFGMAIAAGRYVV